MDSPSDSSNAGGERTGGSQGNFIAVLRIRDFRLLWLGQLISQTGDYFAYTAMMLVVSRFSTLRGDGEGDLALAISSLMIVAAVPRLLFGALAGVFADRWPRRRAMLFSDVLRMGMTLLLIPAFLLKSLTAVYLLAFLMSTVSTLFTSAKGAVLPLLVPQEQLMPANTISQVSMMAANFIGPALAGAVFKMLPSEKLWMVFILDSFSFFASGVALWLMSTAGDVRTDRAKLATAGGPLRRVVDDLLVGLKALTQNRTISALAIVCTISFFAAGGLQVLWFVLLKTRYGFVQESELAFRNSIVDMAFFTGMVLASVAVGNVLSSAAPKWLIFWGLVVSGVATAIAGHMPSYWGLVVSVVCLGLFVAPIQAGISTLTQLVVPNDQLGRVGGSISTVTEAAMMSSLALAGVVPKTLGLANTFLVAGALCWLGALLAWIRLPAVKAQRNAPTVTPGEAQPA
ncbi:MFS transporter [Chondromyces crocatus]|uniref:Major facilitator superfamily (MFS) profile domain-containing protein n=1 Tax=Chondromyces crocatus TaxID=52 RepID=A0A0K1EJD5_CHOCO|nr:MFS transporter [Chondromyces crocatus]AKT40693.1 uncharacterized protein CMC5_048490 [Chondromyces crocatus]